MAEVLSDQASASSALRVANSIAIRNASAETHPPSLRLIPLGLGLGLGRGFADSATERSGGRFRRLLRCDQMGLLFHSRAMAQPLQRCLVHDGEVTFDRSAPVAYARSDKRWAAAFAAAVYGGEPFLAKAALEAGLLTRHDLRTRFRRIHPRVFVTKPAELTPRQRVRAAWLWGGPTSVLCGGASAYALGEEYFGAELLEKYVQLWRPSWSAPPPGIVLHRWSEPPAVVTIHGMAVTSPARTAIDLARHLPSDVRAVAALDSMCRTAGLRPGEIADAAVDMAGHSGVRRVLGLLPAVDPRAESPKETELRLHFAGAGLPLFDSQVEVFDEVGRLVSRLDLGSRRWKVGLQYDGGGHLQRERRDQDSLTMMRLAALGWEVRRVTQGMLASPGTLRGFTAGAFRRQGWKGSQ